MSGEKNQLTFSNNTANGTGNEDGGGAIYALEILSGSGNTLEFSENTAAKSGGAIYRFGNLYSSSTGNNNQLTFSKNKSNGTGATDGGGAIWYFTKFSGSGNILEFSENTAAKCGGAIYRFGDLYSTVGNNNTLIFQNNKANGTSVNDGGGAIWNLTKFSGSGNILDFSENTAKSGGAIYKLGNSSTTGLTGDNNKLTFSNNKANGTGATDGGGAIYNFGIFSGSGNTLEFSENTARSGGAIYKLGDWSYGTASGGLTGNNNQLTFSKNTANGTGSLDGGGAIYELNNLSGSGNILTFSGNSAKYWGGAIYNLTNFSGSGNTLEFSGNTAVESGGAIYKLGNSSTTGLTGDNNKLTFSNNTANGTSVYYDGGGAIGTLLFLSGSGNTLEFTGNTAANRGGAINHLSTLSGSGNTLTFTGNTAGTSGGAIASFTTLSGENNTLTFTGNTAGGNGGAIGSFTTLSGENNTLTFTGNTAGGNGGAICSNSNYSITFSGNNTLTFTGNKAGTKGNDIFLTTNTPIFPPNLTFSGGTYSFDGGIWINHETASTTISNGAKVTIAGRNDDSVNEYEFRDVALTANLTATVDDIEYLHGNFTVGENGLMTINKGSDTATIKSSTNYGVMDLLINKAENVETISISSGRIDIKGCIDATIELQNDAELQSVASFSPGNSAGRLETTGDFIATAGSLLIFEQEGDVYDQLIANNVTIDPETGIDLSLFTTFAPGAVYDIIIANGTLSVDQSWIDMIQSGLPEFVEASIYNGNTVRLKIDANAVPEPSTWALLILGAAGLAYMRKRSRQ